MKILKQKADTLENIIDESPYKNKKINFLSIDIENHEYEALKNFNFEKYPFDVIAIEIHDLNQKTLEIYNQSIEFVLNSDIYKLLERNKYKLINWVNSDFIFIKNNIDLK